MVIAFWIIGGLTSLAFLAAGLMEATRPKTALAGTMAWVEDSSGGAVEAIGVVEILGALGIILPALGIILPALTGIAVVRSPVAATGLVVVIVAAAIVHVRRLESMVPPIVLAILAAATAVLGFAAL